MFDTKMFKEKEYNPQENTEWINFLGVLGFVLIFTGALGIAVFRAVIG